MIAFVKNDTLRSATTVAIRSSRRCRFAGGGCARERGGGFTLAELVVSLSILVLLVAVLTPSLTSSVLKSRDHRCQTSLRLAACDFTVFAMERGARRTSKGERGFRLTDFMASQYRVLAYWGHADEGPVRVSMSDVFGCARVEAIATLDPGVTCITKAVGPGSSVSYAFNARLVRAEKMGKRRLVATTDVRLGSSIVDQGRVPLVWDSDGGGAERAGKSAHFSAPPLGTGRLYDDGSRWFPARRHSGVMQVGYVDGSVGASRDPVREDASLWGFQAVR